jgi:hypothetical protein
MPITPIPERVADPKDAVLWAIFDTLQRIDENQSSRLSFATKIFFNAQLGMAQTPLFEHEINQLRQILNIPVPKPEATEPVSRADEELKDVETMREI